LALVIVTAVKCLFTG